MKKKKKKQNCTTFSKFLYVLIQNQANYIGFIGYMVVGCGYKNIILTLFNLNFIVYKLHI